MLANLVLGIIFLVKNLHAQPILAAWILTIVITLFVVGFRLRTYPLKVQDRVIRLEERLRLTEVLSDPLRKRIPDLSEDQLVALRFASNAELPALVELALDKGLNRKQIKQRIQLWRADHFRI
jgi:hypothetical protein